MESVPFARDSTPAFPGGILIRKSAGPTPAPSLAENALMQSTSAATTGGTVHPDTGRWGRIPAWWLEHPDLDADGFAVLAALATFADENGLCWPSQSTLAGKLKRSRPTINRILQGLSDIGLVTIEHRRGRDGARLSCLYRLRFTRDGNNTAELAAEFVAEPTRPSRPKTSVHNPSGAMNRDDSPADAPCPAPSQEQLDSEQNPDSLASGGRGPALDVPADWMPDADDLAWARGRFGDVDLARHVEGFVLRCQAHGYRYRNIGAAWRAWLVQDMAAEKPLNRAANRASNRPARPKDSPATGSPAPVADRTRENPAEQRVNAWMAVAARFQGARPDTRCRS